HDRLGPAPTCPGSFGISSRSAARRLAIRDRREHLWLGVSRLTPPSRSACASAEVTPSRRRTVEFLKRYPLNTATWTAASHSCHLKGRGRLPSAVRQRSPSLPTSRRMSLNGRLCPARAFA